MTSPKSYKEKQTEQQRGKKRYIERLVEEQEAEEEIKHYENITDDSDAYRHDGERSERSERSKSLLP